ncbi:16S rRNA (cytosine(1402)-N(4))-methyltransferase RsmH [Candidatus Saccharibacteria bacterium]|nr:16S rRNA (cytosine(1402)-N(4))-methyltransferase RsmH [Candidatus Saccharibacteria bacterium]
MKKMQHIPVLLGEVLEVLKPKAGNRFADFTAGYGGHSTKLLKAVGKHGFGYLFDQDPAAIQHLAQQLKDHQNVVIKQANFGDLDWVNDLPTVDIMLVDLGVSSPQLDTPRRGFSFRQDGPLDMRMDTQQSLTAAEIVNTYRERELADLIYCYGEERRSRQIAKAVVEARTEAPIETTLQLADIVHAVMPKGKIDSATRTFQALRIAVNDEIGALESFLQNFPAKLAPGGRIAIVSFHSLEDRLVKQTFKILSTPTQDQFGQVASKPQFKLVTKKPIVVNEYDLNPRARSGKLRAVEKIN